MIPGMDDLKQMNVYEFEKKNMDFLLLFRPV